MRTYYHNNDSFKCYEVDEFNYRLLNCAINSRSRNVIYMDNIIMFDIETSSYYAADIDNIRGFMYHWQICIDSRHFIYGRRWEEFEEFLLLLKVHLHLSKNQRAVIYVQNLSFEFWHMINFLIRVTGEAPECFFTRPRTVLKCVFNDFGIEFRCLYKLTNMSLEIASNKYKIKHPKLVGDLDYNVLRTPETRLSDKNFNYCMADVLSGCEILEQLLKKDTYASIPMTSTGYIRRNARKSTEKNENYYVAVFCAQELSVDHYLLLKEESRGGNTHANRFKAGRIQYDDLSFDIKSSYIFDLLCMLYPMSKWSLYEKSMTFKEFMEEYDELCEDYCIMGRVLLPDIAVRDCVSMPYLSEAKQLKKSSNTRLDNGRILCADFCYQTFLLDVELPIIISQYEFNADMAYVTDIHISKKGLLPEEIRDYVKSVFYEKCELDNEEGRASGLYDKKKNELNGIFGMMFTDPIQESLVFNPDNLLVEPEITTKTLEENLHAFYKSRNHFLNYSWGCYTTAWARYWLQQILDITDSFDATIYCDTDSDKCKYIPEMLPLIDELNEKIINISMEHGAYWENPDTHEKIILGVFENETDKGHLKEFISLGAKRYAYTDYKGKLHTVISGVSKKNGAEELKSIKNFKNNFVFKKSGKLTLHYNDDTSIYHINVNGVDIETSSNIGMENAEYTLGLSADYAELIGIPMDFS